MKNMICAILVAAVMTVTSGVTNTAGQVRDPRIQSGVFEFNEPVKLLDAVLHGKYLFLHHEGMMERGRECIFVYHAKSGGFVMSLHCRPVKRDRVEQLRIVLKREPACDSPSIEEIQFAGSTDGHLVCK